MRVVVNNWTPDSLNTAYHGGARVATTKSGYSYTLDQKMSGGWWLLNGAEMDVWGACYILNMAEAVTEYSR